ncbi:MAG: SAM-dependent MidA family methyltransferase [Rickettsiales bacterium]|jgi:SAM-dependent MidA family methyltransferase
MKSHLKNLIKVNGAISVAQFMNESLFHPKFGYYNQQNPFGKEGDFVTSSEISQVFGELIGAYLVNLWQNKYSNKKINLVEAGAGKGTLMKDFLNFSTKIPHFSEKFNISIIEISPRLQEIQKINLKGFKVSWYKDFAEFFQKNSSDPIFFMANELFDCFAIHQFIKTKKGLVERMVGIDGEDLQFKFRPAIAPTELGVRTMKDGDFFEHSPSSQNFMSEISAAIKQTGGIGLIIDYGYLQSTVNTLQALKDHQYQDVLKEVGNADITALVDFSALQDIAIQNNLETSIITQREFLLALGIESRREALLAGVISKEHKNISSGIDRLIDRQEMGELFKVLICW